MAKNNKKYVELIWHQKYDKIDLGEKLPIEKPNLPFQTVETVNKPRIIGSRQNTVGSWQNTEYGGVGKLEKFEDLKVWQRAHRLVLEIYKITKDYPKEEKFALVSQMRRAAVSIPANIAEGFKKRGRKDKCNFYNIAQGSLGELKYYLIISKDLGYIEDNVSLISDIDEISKMLHALICAVRGEK